jgi:hypothetical protein
LSISRLFELNQKHLQLSLCAAYHVTIIYAFEGIYGKD